MTTTRSATAGGLVIETQGLRKVFRTRRGEVRVAVDGSAWLALL